MDPAEFLGALLGSAGEPADGGEELLLVVDGREYWLDAQSGSATLADPAGVGVFSDFDGDGLVDHVSLIDAAGEVMEWGLGAGRIAGGGGAVASWGIAGDTPPDGGI